GTTTGRAGWRNFVAGGAIAATLLCAAGFGVYGGNHDSSQTPRASKGPAVTGSGGQRPPAPGKTVSLGPLTGHLKLRFIDRPPPGSGKAKVSGPREGETSPLFNGQKVQLHVTLNRPAHVYLFWIDSNGTTGPIYPWDFGHSTALWDAPWVPGS